MNADDKERLEVACKLREGAANDELRRLAFVEEIIAGCIGETLHDEWGGVRDVEILTKLADLIDRPTCHLVKDEDGRTICSECEGTALGKLDAVYCPECGAEVVRDGDWRCRAPRYCGDNEDNF